MKIYYSRCTEKGGGSNLVSLHSQAENEFVAGLLPMVCAFTCFSFYQGGIKLWRNNYTVIKSLISAFLFIDLKTLWLIFSDWLV